MQFKEQELKEVLSTVLKVDISYINDDTSPDTVESWDSLKHLMLVLALEEKFNFSFTEEQTIEIVSYPLIKLVLMEHGIQFI